MDNNTKPFWFKLTRKDNNKHDYCKINSTSKENAEATLANILINYKYIKCEYFSKDIQYKRKTSDIIYYQSITEQEVDTFIRRVNYIERKSRNT